MFGKEEEFLDYTVRPTQEGRELLVEQALERIETIDEVDYLDGYKLPPDNDEVWNQRTIRMIAFRTYEDPVTGKLYSRQEESEHESTLTNSYIRKANISLIASGSAPLFIKWEDIDLSQIPPYERPIVRVRKAARKILEKLAS